MKAITIIFSTAVFSMSLLYCQHSSANISHTQNTSFCRPFEVSLVYFKGKMQEKKSILLEWASTFDIEQTYEVERSSDGVNFESLGFANEPEIISSTRYYAFTDMNPQNGVNFYRLKKWTIDFRFGLSTTIMVAVNSSASQDLKIYPNPAKNYIHYLYNAPAAGVYSFKITSSSGIVLTGLKYYCSKGMNQLEFDISMLRNGLYFISADADRHNNSSFIKN